MLRPPCSRYDRLHVYSPLDDPDLIGIWIEDDTAVLFFHQPKEALVRDLCGRTGASLVDQPMRTVPGMEPDLPAALPADRIRMLHRADAQQWRLRLLRCGDTGREQE